MNSAEKSSAKEHRQTLLALCRFLAIRLTHHILLILLAVTGLFLSLLQHSHFAPYGIALLGLLLPFYLNSTMTPKTEKENSDSPLSALYRRYHYSPVTFVSYRITLLFCLLLLVVWYIVPAQAAPLMLFGISLPLLYLALGLALYPLLSWGLFFFFHRRLMNGGF